MPKRHRVIGTTEEALARAEAQLGRRLPASFRAWLMAHNGGDLHGMEVFPVLDDRDPRKTWDSIVRQNADWKAGTNGEMEDLLAFVYEDGDCYCFDYSAAGTTGEPPVVHWSHETGEVTPCAESFTDFARMIAEEMEEFEDDAPQAGNPH